MPSKQLKFRCFCSMCKYESGNIGNGPFVGQELLSTQRAFHQAKCAAWEKSQASVVDALAQRLNSLSTTSDGCESRVTSGSWSSRNDTKDGPETLDPPDVRSSPSLQRVLDIPLEGATKDTTSLTIAKQSLAKVEAREANHATKKHLDLLSSIEADLKTILSNLPDPKTGIRLADIEELLDRSELMLHRSHTATSQIIRVTNTLTQRKEEVHAVLNQVEERLADWRNTVPSPSVYDCSERPDSLLYALQINLYLEVTCSTQILTRCPPPIKLLFS